MSDDVEQFGYFAFLWEVVFMPIRLKNDFYSHTSWNTLLHVAKMAPRDFPNHEEDIDLYA